MAGENGAAAGNFFPQNNTLANSKIGNLLFLAETGRGHPASRA
jgi:hypothetical protein